MNGVPHRSMVISMIGQACTRFGVKFDRTFSELRNIYTNAAYDDLAAISLLGVGLSESRRMEAERKDQFIEACKKVGLL